jgi:tetratricopeptide (TPR) repeat protein
MSQLTPNSNRSRAWPRYLLGGPIALLSLAALIWIAVLFYAEWRYRAIPIHSTEESERESRKDLLEQYAANLNRLLNLDPSNGEIRNIYASVLGKLGDVAQREKDPKAMQYYAEAVNNHKLARQTQNAQNSLYFLADMYEKMGDLSKGEDAMARCLKINPADQQFNRAWLRQLNKRLLEIQTKKAKKIQVDPAVEAAARRAYGEATLNWAIRAPFDLNSYLFLGNFYVEPLYPLQAYRCYLIGLSQSRWMDQKREPLIQIKLVLNTIHQILDRNYAKPYRGLP